MVDMRLDIKNANGDSALQISQIQEFIDEQVSALIIDPVDSYGLTDILKNCKGARDTGYFL